MGSDNGSCGTSSATSIGCEELHSTVSTVSGKGCKEYVKSSVSSLKTDHRDSRLERIFL